MEAVFVKTVSGVVGGLLSATVMQPLDVALKRVQAQDRASVASSDRFHGTWDALVDTVRRNGLTSMYQAIGLSYLSTVVKNSVFFTTYETLKWQAGPGYSQQQQLLMGMLSGMVTTVFLLPVQVVATIKNVHSNRGARLSTSQALQQVVDQRGLGGLFVGLGPGLVLSVYPAIQNLIFDRLRSWYLHRQQLKELPAQVAFVLGVLANVCALSVTYPLIFLKIRLQAQRGNGPLLSPLGMAQRIVANSGPLGLWQGMTAQLTNAMFSNAIQYSSKEAIQNWVQNMTK